MSLYACQRSGMALYQAVNTSEAIDTASPHYLILLLLQGALEKISLARANIRRGETALKSSHITWAISIIEGLRVCLDRRAGGEIADNLDALYEYMTHRLARANGQGDLEALTEVSGLLEEIKVAWESIPAHLGELSHY